MENCSMSYDSKSEGPKFNPCLFIKFCSFLGNFWKSLEFFGDIWKHLEFLGFQLEMVGGDCKVLGLSTMAQQHPTRPTSCHNGGNWLGACDK